MASVKTIHVYMLTLNFLCFKKCVHVCVVLKIIFYTVYCDYDFPPVKSPISSPFSILETPHFLSLSLWKTNINLHESKYKAKQTKTKPHKKHPHKYLHMHTHTPKTHKNKVENHNIKLKRQ